MNTNRGIQYLSLRGIAFENIKDAVKAHAASVWGIPLDYVNMETSREQPHTYSVFDYRTGAYMGEIRGY
jgi:hypothetical protein